MAKLTAIQSIINDQSINPPGGDHSLGSFYSAIGAMLKSRDNLFSRLCERTLLKRHITSSHAVNLMARAFQFEAIKQGDLSFRHFTNSNQWAEMINKMVEAKQIRTSLASTFTNRHTQTTILQRCAGPWAIIAHIFKGSSVRVADIGCGLNLALPAMELNLKCQPVVDLTPNRPINKLLKSQINLEEGFAYDREDPQDPIVRQWIEACSFYPGELDKLTDLRTLVNKVTKKSNNVFFKKANVLDPGWSLPKKVNVIIVCTMMYQISKKDKQKLLSKIQEQLSPEGIIIVQDFATLSPKNKFQLSFKESWFKKPYSYGTFVYSAKTNWQFQEIFRWENGRCKTVKAGIDFNKFFPKPRLNHSRTFNAT